MAFFPTYKERFTRTPNVFFDVILKDPTVTLNQVRLVAYLIRQTIGYNKEAKWAAVSRSVLVDEAGIPNGRIKDAIAGCEKKEWILVYEHGKGTKKERYIFLNDERNIRIVQGLQKGCFTIDDLQYLNLAGIDKLLEKHGIPVAYTETVEEQRFSYTETVEAAYTETVEADKAKQQAVQGIGDPLNTSFKDNIKDNDENVVASYQEEFKNLFNQELSEQDAKSFAQEAERNGKDLRDYLHYVKTQSEKKEVPNPVGYLREAVFGNWNVPSIAELEQAAAKEEAEKAAVNEIYNNAAIAALVAAGLDPKKEGF